MKYFFISISLFLLVICFESCRNSNKIIERPFKIIGMIDDTTIESLIFRYNRCGIDSVVIDTINVTNGTFTIQGFFSSYTWSRLTINDKDVSLFLDTGDKHLFLKIDSLEQFIIKGSQTYIEKEKLEYQTKPLENNLYEIEKQLSLEEVKINKEFLMNKKDSIEILLEKIRIDYITKHTDSYYSIDVINRLLVDKKISGDKLLNFYNGLSEDVKNSCNGKDTYKFIQQRQVSSMTNVASLKAFDKYGNLVKLSDFKGKYILIDCWASWCVPCINKIPHINELYAKYKEKGLVLIGISIDHLEDEQKWLDAIEKYNISEWIHFLFFRNTEENSICYLYEPFTGVPHYILIDRSGNIIKYWHGGSDEVANEQKDMFSEIFRE